MSKYSTQFKLKVVKEYLKFGGLRRIANLHEINTSDIRNWTLAYQTHGLRACASCSFCPMDSYFMRYSFCLTY